MSTGRAFGTPTRPDKLLWPSSGVTKRIYLEYLEAVADDLLPWLRDRPLTLVRAPDGVEQQRYYQKETPTYAPSWIKTVPIRAETARRTVRYVLCNGERTLAWLGNQAAVEFHPSAVRASRLDRPDVLLFDLDPPPGRYSAAVEVAGILRDVLEELGLRSGIKTSGSKGLHVVVPIERRSSVAEVQRAGARVAAAVVGRAPGLATTEFRIADRGGRVLIDIWRNAVAQTAVAAFSPRARPEATVSFPVTWSEVPRVEISDFTIATVPSLLDAAGPRAWRELLRGRSRLPSSLTAAG